MLLKQTSNSEKVGDVNTNVPSPDTDGFECSRFPLRSVT